MTPDVDHIEVREYTEPDNRDELPNEATEFETKKFEKARRAIKTTLHKLVRLFRKNEASSTNSIEEDTHDTPLRTESRTKLVLKKFKSALKSSFQRAANRNQL